MVGLGEPELVDEDLRELVVLVLARVDDDLVDPARAERLGERRGLDELRPVAHDRDDLHGASVAARLGRIPTARQRPSAAESARSSASAPFAPGPADRHATKPSGRTSTAPSAPVP